MLVASAGCVLVVCVGSVVGCCCCWQLVDIYWLLVLVVVGCVCWCVDGYCCCCYLVDVRWLLLSVVVGCVCCVFVGWLMVL